MPGIILQGGQVPQPDWSLATTHSSQAATRASKTQYASSMARGSSRRALDGNHVLYRYLQTELQRSDVWLFQMLAARLVVGLGVWLEPEIYRRYPLLRPYAVRDPQSRGDTQAGIADQWGSPDSHGLFRDDNSLIKRMPYSLPIRGAGSSLYDGARIKQGFVASHVWRRLHGDAGLAARNRLTYSFVPNLVWLPREVSKLTDREGSFVQAYVQALSMKIYRGIEVSPRIKPIVEDAWNLLPSPTGIPAEGLPDPGELNYFAPTEVIFRRWISDLRKVIEALDLARERRPISRKVIASRYAPGLSELSRSTLAELADELRTYAAAAAHP